MPENLPVHGLHPENEFPEWNCRDPARLYFEHVFEFAEKYLTDDGGVILLTPIGYLEDLESDYLTKYGFEVSMDWLCHQPVPLCHPQYTDKLVSFLVLYVLSDDVFVDSLLYPFLTFNRLWLCRLTISQPFFLRRGQGLIL
jgi:hypothetical protein